ncbi:MarR family winged helix-turn-helix transcriptional regulator [Devosia psychrophila]|uniref:MarR family transcriptional regulator n=1 Tax=Devosia psychrophila TaxID=728005 RepID=A0A0F5PV38_9HYPH|nr:MarR family transcriptional regulator [Devosia psychrophila]KKC31674.1 MarR family transcriptional regulator [Devosia psychrophila]SFB93474.1 transcriptional regulator, MarR family [Devosia psychrophila]
MALTRESSAGYMTNWAARLFARELERQLAPSGIAPAYMPVLFALADGSALTQKELARRAAVEQPTMAATLNRMERDAMIIRTRDPEDKRSALVALTPLAQGKIETVERVVSAINELALEQLVPDERRQFIALLGRVIRVLEAQDGALGN